jgi:hypothetical protein
MRFPVRRVLAAAALCACAPLSAAAQDSQPFNATDGPPPPALTETIARDEAGRATVRAIPLPAPLRVDGALDDEIYRAFKPMTGFTQAEPRAGEPANEQTEIWIFYDRENIYVSARCWESRPDRLMANELRRDHNNIIQNDNIAFGFDTFYDRRSGVVVETTPIGAKLDVQYAYEGQNNYDWNPIWDVKVKRFEQGWTIESVIPFKSLRYRAGHEQLWGFNVRRSSRWRNEISYLNPIPASFGMGGIFHSEMFAPLIGLQLPPGSSGLEIKPYVFANVTTDRTVTPQITNDVGADYGVDLKYGITQNVTLDVTYNTDFAQVEADNQQVNLTRFSLFFPEKRDFFLENQGLFNFGGGSSNSDAPVLFYSRRIGLNAGREVPIDVGARLTGRVGGFTVGLINIQADDEPVSGARATNFSVVRLKRDVLRKSTVGLLATHRSIDLSGRGGNSVLGADARLAFFDDLLINAYVAGSSTETRAGDDHSYRVHLDYSGDRYGIQAERLAIGAKFNPEVGFVRRADVRKTFGEFRFSPRTRSNPVVRKYSTTGALEFFENGRGVLESREARVRFALDLHNSDGFNVQFQSFYEYLPQAFAIAPGVVLPVADYDFTSTTVSYEFGRQRQMSGTLSYEQGTFYNGDRRILTVSGARVNFSPRFSVEPSTSVNWIDLQQGAFTTTLVGSRVTFTMTPMMFASALLQYNSSSNSLSSNIRLRWEYVPGSELFVVYNEQRDTRTVRFPALANRAFIVKFNRLLRL